VKVPYAYCTTISIHDISISILLLVPYRYSTSTGNDDTKLTSGPF